jgi:hypothetical protein
MKPALPVGLPGARPPRLPVDRGGAADGGPDGNPDNGPPASGRLAPGKLSLGGGNVLVQSIRLS